MNYSKYILSALLLFAGIMHFAKPDFFVKIMPAYIPFHLKMVYLSGAVEILCGILLLFPQTQTIGAWLSIALLLRFSRKYSNGERFLHRKSSLSLVSNFAFTLAIGFNLVGI